MTQVILMFLFCYLLGSIPFSVVVGKLFYGVDVRKAGSGNPGATNTLRVLGTKAGLIVLLLDIGKGVLAVLIVPLIIGPWILPKLSADFSHLIFIKDIQAICGALAILGHVYSPFLKFKGGKGVATSIGTVLALQPYIGLIMIGVFALILISTRYVSLGSIISAALYPVLSFFMEPYFSVILAGFSILLAAMIIIKHKDNIKRLLSGTENKFSPGAKKS